MITYQIRNVLPEGNGLRVFYYFSNDQTNSHLFEESATLVEIKQWASDRCAYFEQRELDIAAAAAALEGEE